MRLSHADSFTLQEQKKDSTEAVRKHDEEGSVNYLCVNFINMWISLTYITLPVDMISKIKQ